MSFIINQLKEIETHFQNFENIYFLWASVFFLVLFWSRYFISQRKISKVFHPKRLKEIKKNQSLKKIIFKHILVQLAIIMLVIALMKPKWGTKEDLIENKGVDIMLVIDISKSMLVEDVLPNRLERTKLSIFNFLDIAKYHRIGIVVFSGSSFLLAPLTKDYSILKKFIRNINTDIASDLGTDLSNGLDTAIHSLEANNVPNREKVILLFTDGETHNSDIFNQGEEAKKNKIKIYSIGVGTLNGEFIPIKNTQGRIIDFLKDDSGKAIISKLDQKSLIEISLLTEGKYFFPERGFNGIKKIFREINVLGREELENSGSDQASNYFTKTKDQYQIFLFLAFIFLFLNNILTARKNQFFSFNRKSQKTNPRNQ